MGTAALCGPELGPTKARPRARPRRRGGWDVVLGDSYCCSLTSSCGPRGSARGLDAVVLRRRKPAFRQGRGSLIVIIRPPWKTRSARVGWTKRRATRGRRSYRSANYMFMCPYYGSGFGIDAACEPHRCTPDHLHEHGKTKPSEVVSNKKRLTRPGSVAQRDRRRDPNMPLSAGRLVPGDPANVDRT